MAINVPDKYKKIIPAAFFVILAIAGIAYYDKIQNDRKNAAIENKREYTADEKSKMEERIIELEKKIQEPPKDATAVDKYSWNMQIGFQKMALEKFSQAKEAFLAASAIQPSDYTAWLALYEVSLAEKDYNSARENIKKAISFDPSNPELWKKYIKLEKEKLGAKDEQIVQLFTESFASTRSDIEIMAFYAKFLEEKGDLKGAIEQWKKSMSADQQNKNVYQAEISRLEALIK